MKHTIKTWGRCLAIAAILALSTASNGAEFEVYNWTLSLALRFGESGKRYIDLDAGPGKYWGHTMYIDCVAIPSCFDADTRSVKGSEDHRQ